MDTPSPSMRNLARRLLATSQSMPGPHDHGVVLVSEKLRIALTRFAGADGFSSLLRRALALASAEIPSLHAVKVGADGRLEGLERLDAETGGRAVGGEAGVAIMAHLLWLLSTFIGEAFTLRLVREAWGDTSLDELNHRTEAD